MAIRAADALGGQGYDGEEFGNWVGWVRPKLKVEVVERTFEWLMRHRRLIRDCGTTEISVAAWISVTMIYGLRPGGWPVCWGVRQLLFTRPGSALLT